MNSIELIINAGIAVINTHGVMLSSCESASATGTIWSLKCIG